MMMARRGRGRRGRPRGTGQAPSMSDQQTFAEAIGITANAIAQAGIAQDRKILVTSKGLGRIILRHSQGEETRW